MTRVDFKDHFSRRAAEYSRFRPDYPPELYEYVLRKVSRFDAAWDAGTGNGQVAAVLSRSFKKVYANDGSIKQIEHAARADNIEYFVSPSESVPIPSGGVDLVTAAQALHWFAHDLFYAEVRRVARAEGALVAAWAYGSPSVSPDIDSAMRRFDDEVIGPCWPAERGYVESRYETVPFPFERLKTPPFAIEKRLRLASFLGYVSTWSAVKNYIEKRGADPVEPLGAELSAMWGGEEEKTVRWPLFVLAGFVRPPD
jgi:SAM-dependent methyltransferase